MLHLLRYSYTFWDWATFKYDSDYLASKETAWSYSNFVHCSTFLCEPVFSAHSNLLYDNNKYANGTTICTPLKVTLFLSSRINFKNPGLPPKGSICHSGNWNRQGQSDIKRGHSEYDLNSISTSNHKHTYEHIWIKAIFKSLIHLYFFWLNSTEKFFCVTV